MNYDNLKDQSKVPEVTRIISEGSERIARAGSIAEIIEIGSRLNDELKQLLVESPEDALLVEEEILDIATDRHLELVPQPNLTSAD